MPDDFKENYYNQARLFTSGQLENFIDLFSELLTRLKTAKIQRHFLKPQSLKL